MTRYQEIPWLRIGAESVAIVGSILLAFAIEAWWADQQQREEELILLTSLKEEAQNNLREIDRELVYRRAAADGVTKLLDASAGNSRLESMELDQLLGTLVWWLEASWVCWTCPACPQIRFARSADRRRTRWPAREPPACPARSSGSWDSATTCSSAPSLLCAE